jgi:hypothetical protein
MKGRESMSTRESEIRADIERTRDELGDNVEELAARADVKARARSAVGSVRDRAVQTGQRVGATVRRAPAPAAAAAAAALASVAAAVVTGVLLQRRRAAARAAAARQWWRRR